MNDYYERVRNAQEKVIQAFENWEATRGINDLGKLEHACKSLFQETTMTS